MTFPERIPLGLSQSLKNWDKPRVVDQGQGSIRNQSTSTSKDGDLTQVRNTLVGPTTDILGGGDDSGAILCLCDQI